MTSHHWTSGEAQPCPRCTRAGRWLAVRLADVLAVAVDAVFDTQKLSQVRTFRCRAVIMSMWLGCS